MPLSDITKRLMSSDGKAVKPKITKFHHALISVVAMAVIMLTAIVGYGSDPQIPLIFGSLVSGFVAMYIGYTWDEMLKGMLDSIYQALEAILILLLIGVLVGVWIASGTVPTLIYYGLTFITAEFFLPATFIICTLVAFAIGSWGTIGTVGLAFMGIGLALGVPAPLTAGCVISGSYFSGNISPLSDSTNLAAAVTGGDVFGIVRRMMPVAVAGFVVAGVVYGVQGMQYAGGDPEQIAASLNPLLESLAETFFITPVALVPMIAMVVCILVKMPAIPSMLVGAIAGIFIAVPLQGAGIGDIINVGYEGYISETGMELLDNLLTTGGLTSMMGTISIIIIAMAFGGLMQSTGQMEALIRPIVTRMKRIGSLKAVTVLTCFVSNVILPDQYLGISVPGQMYGEEYDKRSVSRVELAECLLAGGGFTSPLVPWNTCGIFCATFLGVGALEYAPFAYFCLAMPLVVIATGFFRKA